MNGNRKLKSLRLVRFGEILYDQQKRLIMLCSSCQRHYLSLDAFQSHLSKCIGIKQIVMSIDELQYDEDKRETRLVNGKQELFIYEPSAVRNAGSVNCNIDWEAELEDPRWYTDDSRPQPCKTKPPPTNAKENVAKAPIRNSIVTHKEREKQSNESSPDTLPCPKRVRRSTPKRTILTNQQQPKLRDSAEMPADTSTIKKDIYNVKNVFEDLSRLEVKTRAVNPMATATVTTGLRDSPAMPANTAKSNNDKYIVKNVFEDLRRLEPKTNTRVVNPMGTATATIATASSTNGVSPAMASIPTAGASSGNTQQILNKLRACGVEVKRRSTKEAVESAGEVDPKKQLALEIMRKLQSHGIKCTKVNNTKQ